MTLDFRPRSIEARNHHRFEVDAEGLGRYTIDVSLPFGDHPVGTRFPVILVTDANLFFDVVQPIVHGELAKQVGLLPPSIVVGVGYPADEGNASFYARRNFDFHGQWDMTDTPGQMLHRIFGMLKAAEGKPTLEIHAGGYGRFMAFLRDELLPALAGRFPIDLAARHTLIGDSSGGHFVLRALYDVTSPFRRYVCISPSFGAGGGAIQKAEAEYAAAHSDLDVDVFLCCGSVEVDENMMSAVWRFGSGITWIAEQFALRQWPGARVHWEVMNNEDHQSITPRAIAAGLRSVHGVRPGVHHEEIARQGAARMEALRALSKG